jgi:hypothetical protein
MYAATVPGRIVERQSGGIVAQGYSSQTVVFYNAHLAPVTMAENTMGGPVTANALLADAFVFDTSSLPPEVLFCVSPLLLVLGGIALGVLGTADATLKTALVTGALMTAGYVAPFVLGALLMTGLTTGVSVPVLRAVSVGVAYPVVFGGLGRYLHGLRARRSRGS